ncbi:glycerol acyltransferase [Mycobacterium sp. CBMA 234]|uniref:lysophospholipid acyltransferase family protein n=1 Tax=Mycolicibacterium sp. CBMA 234 TaxID=1918495 RepID=UPI0012DCDAED|nr:lysophospholipid acyltransferase family protein [Mycolicibacterium sp. CBMA 234]MUL68330.1 glycerol acyltransferase [Mycolicibacterium sp. CBMA 234]
MGFGPPQGRPTVTDDEIAAIMNQSPRVRTLRNMLGATGDALNPLIDLYRPWVTGLDRLPRDGRFLLVGNHTAFGFAEVVLVPYYTRRELGVRVRTLAERALGQMSGLGGDLVAAYGGVVGHPDTARELMRHNETVLVFPGGGREMPKFKGDEYQLKWDGRSGFARVAIESGYPIVPVGLVGSDDVYEPLFGRDSTLGRLSQSIGERLGGPPDMAMPLVRGIGPTLIPRPQRMYLEFGEPISTTAPSRTDHSGWVETVKSTTQQALEQILAALQEIRAGDPYRSLNPLAWARAAQPSEPVTQAG